MAAVSTLIYVDPRELDAINQATQMRLDGKEQEEVLQFLREEKAVSPQTYNIIAEAFASSKKEQQHDYH